MDYLEINAKLKEAENTIQLLKEALTNTNVDTQDWVIHHGRGHNMVDSSAKFYIREGKSYNNVCEVYGGKEKGAQTALIISKVPQMLTIINQLADVRFSTPSKDGFCNLPSSAHTTMFSLNTQAKELQKIIRK